MGILTDPTSSEKRTKYAKILIKGNRFICSLFYVIGLVWFCILANKDLNNATYFSENALLPGLVYSEIQSDRNYVFQLLDELEHERENHKSSMPYAWLISKMRQIGLDTYTHNFTLKYPFGGGKVFEGKNVYGILRAPRIGSTESFIISTPYRPPNSVHSEITHSIPILLTFAKFARRQKYWAKDIIFLITEQEQLGIHAWLNAYQGSEESDVLQSGTLDARAGSVQAALNLEIHGFDINYIDVKIEGLNGQLPNLDLVNLVNRIALKEGFASGHRQTSNKRRSGAKSSHQDNLKHMLGMVLTQSSGVPNGNHGLFHRYGIEALTIEAHKNEASNQQRKLHGATSLIKFIEGISRSLNNLLQRFHRSFFFYLLVASDRYISIGDYTPSLGLMAGSLLINAFIIWLAINHKEEPNKESININFFGVGKFFIAVHVFGFLTAYLPFCSTLDTFFYQRGITTEMFLFSLFATLSMASLITPFFVNFDAMGIQVLHIAALLELGTALIIVGMFNFSLGFILSVFIVPFAIMVNIESVFLRSFPRLICLLLHPLVATYLIVLAVTVYSFPELFYGELLKRALTVCMDAITFSVVDSIIYGNWIFDLVAVIFFPVWIMFWTVLLCNFDTKKALKIKTN